MLSKKMEKALNEQINAELYSSYLYLSMAAWFQTQNLPGFAAWMRVQAKEEDGHAMRFFDFINERRGRRIVYLPYYRGAELLNDAARHVWEDLSYDVRPVDCTETFRHFGGLHCLANILRKR